MKLDPGVFNSKKDMMEIADADHRAQQRKRAQKIVVGRLGGAEERFVEWFTGEKFGSLSLKEIASLAFDAGHAFQHASAAPEPIHATPHDGDVDSVRAESFDVSRLMSFYKTVALYDLVIAIAQAAHVRRLQAVPNAAPEPIHASDAVPIHAATMFGSKGGATPVATPFGLTLPSGTHVYYLPIEAAKAE